MLLDLTLVYIEVACFCKDTRPLFDIHPLFLLIYESIMILHYCYKVNQDFNGTTVLLPNDFFSLYYNACLQQADYAV